MKKGVIVLGICILALFLLSIFLKIGREVKVKKVQKEVKEMFVKGEIPPSILEKMSRYSCKDGICTKEVKELRYLQVTYIDFDGNTQKGELIVDYRIADDLLSIFKELYQAQYPLESIRLIDDFEANDDLSMKHNNTSAFNFRYIKGTNKISKHGEGLAIDINPLYNPQVLENGITLPEEGARYKDREMKNPHQIDQEDLAYQLFIKYGFSWGGNWSYNKDYQHFEKEL